MISYIDLLIDSNTLLHNKNLNKSEAEKVIFSFIAKLESFHESKSIKISVEIQNFILTKIKEAEKIARDYQSS